MRPTSLAFAALVALTSLAAAGCQGAAEAEIVDTSEDELVSRTTGLRLAAFIPCDGVDTFGLYDGDGRGFSYAGAAESSRALLDVSLDPDGDATFKPTMFPSKKFSGAAAASKRGWCVTLKDGARADRTAVASADRVFATVREDARTERVGSTDYSVTTARLEAHAKNPLIPFGLAPNTDAVVVVEVYYLLVGGKKTPRWLTFAGYHDAFPSWELYADGQPVFQYDVLASGKGPTDLFPGNEREVSGVCGKVGARWTCERAD